jgi:hypothetical protein
MGAVHSQVGQVRGLRRLTRGLWYLVLYLVILYIGLRWGGGGEGLRLTD